MGDVALSRIKYGGESKREADGSFTEVKPVKYIEAGEAVPSGALSKEDTEQLKAQGVIGDAAVLATTAQSTPAVLQSEEYESMHAAELAAAENTPPQAPSAPPTEDEIAEAHITRTDQVARAEGKDAEAVIKETEKGQDKAEKADEKAAKK